MAKSPRELLAELKEYSPKFAAAQPEVVKAFGVGVKNAAMSDGALTGKTKELMALAIAVHARCDYCIAYHVKACIQTGASDEEMLEACSVAVQMGGGPAMAYASLVVKAIEELRA